MYYSKQISKLNSINQQIKDLLKERKSILEAMVPDVKYAIKRKMDWTSFTMNNGLNIDLFGDLKTDIRTTHDPGCRYVFTITPKEGDEFTISLDFREEFSKY